MVSNKCVAFEPTMSGLASNCAPLSDLPSDTESESVSSCHDHVLPVQQEDPFWTGLESPASNPNARGDPACGPSLDNIIDTKMAQEAPVSDTPISSPRVGMKRTRSGNTLVPPPVQSPVEGKHVQATCLDHVTPPSSKSGASGNVQWSPRSCARQLQFPPVPLCLPLRPPVSMSPCKRLNLLGSVGKLRPGPKSRPRPIHPSPAPRPVFGPTSCTYFDTACQPLQRPMFVARAWYRRHTLQDLAGGAGGSEDLRPEVMFKSHLPGAVSKAATGVKGLAGVALSKAGAGVVRSVLPDDPCSPRVEQPGRQVKDLDARVSKMPRVASGECPSRQSVIHKNNWAKIMPIWAEVTSALQHASPILQALETSSHRAALQGALLSRISDTTALRYLATVRQLLTFLHDMSLDAASLPPVMLIDAIYALRADPCAKIHASNSLKAIKWVTKLLELPWNPYSSLFQVFDPQVKQKRESLPLPLGFVVFLERQLRDANLACQTRVFAGSLLLMICASMRFSDMVHVEWKSISMDGMVLRGVSYRTKTSQQGMPWAIDGSGFLGHAQSCGQSWPALYLQLLGTVWDSMAARFGKDWSPDCLFVMWSEEEFAPLSYSQALRRLRMLIEAFSGGLAAESYTLHSAKCTFLSWMSERLLTPESRRLQGHHRSGSTQLYSRDDTWCALDAQQSLLSAIRQGGFRLLPLPGARKPRCVRIRWTLPCRSVRALQNILPSCIRLRAKFPLFWCLRLSPLACLMFLAIQGVLCPSLLCRAR